MPAPYAKDHPQGALLRRKSLTLWQDIDAAARRDGLSTAPQDGFAAVRPAVDLLRAMI